MGIKYREDSLYDNCKCKAIDISWLGLSIFYFHWHTGVSDMYPKWLRFRPRCIEVFGIGGYLFAI